MLRRSTPLLALAALAVSACDQADLVPPMAPDAAPNARAPVAGPGLQQAPDFVPGRVLALFSPGAPAAAIAGQQGASIERTMALGIQVLSVPEGAETRVAAALARNPNVEFAELDLIHTFGDPAVMPVDDPFIGYKWDLDNDGKIYDSQGNVLATTGAADADMDWREAVDALPSSNGSARIGITDTGIRNDHEELAGRIAAQHDFFAGDPDAEDDNGHGSHVAGIAAANTDNGVGTAGVAYTGTVDFAIAKVCGRTNPGRFGYGCPTSAIADGIVFVVDNGAHVINISLGGGSGSSAVQSALQHARSNGVLPFCAAGNDSGSVSFPAAWPECVAVSATDWGDNLASYSNFGSQVELSAPGGDTENGNGYSYILSAYNEGPDSYAFMAGTSMASPQAAGLGALLHVLGVTDDGDKLARMKSTADDLGPSGTDNQFGAGRINVAAAVAGEGDPPPDNQAPTADFTFSCTELSCDFTDGSSDSDGSVVGWSWDFGGDGNSTEQSPSHTFSEAGTYSVELTVTDDDGATDITSQGVTVSESEPENQAPTADFTFTCTDLACDFTDQSTDDDGSVATWSWDFGGDGNSTQQSPSHTFSEAGTYLVELTVTDDDGAGDVTSQSVTVSAPDPGGITLNATGYKVQGQHHVDLEWSGATSTSVDILLDGLPIDTVASDSDPYTHSTNNRGPGSYTFQVCEAGSTTSCSAEVTVTF